MNTRIILSVFSNNLFPNHLFPNLLMLCADIETSSAEISNRLRTSTSAGLSISFHPGAMSDWN